MANQCLPGTFPYIIHSGDTYFRLAQRYNTTIEAITQANPGVDPDNLHTGQTICIPTEEPPVTCPPGSRGYTVERGDSLFSIAKKFGVSTRVITAANPGVDWNNLQIGQIICIPALPACPGNTIHYAIEPGDTYFNLARRFGITVDSIIAANPGVDPDRLRIGQIICLPVSG